jgi:hypothetical protein
VGEREALTEAYGLLFIPHGTEAPGETNGNPTVGCRHQRHHQCDC